MLKSTHGTVQKARQQPRLAAQAPRARARRRSTGSSKKAQAVVTNPHGANQYVLDPRQSLFVSLYLDPKSKTFGNATQSAIKAGYEESTADNILAHIPAWLSGKLGEYRASTLLEKAERNIDKFLDIPTRVQAMGAFGPIFQKKNGRKVPVFVESGKLLEIKQKTSHFVAERIGKKRYGKESDDTPPPRSILNMTQIIIHPPAQNAS